MSHHEDDAPLERAPASALLSLDELARTWQKDTPGSDDGLVLNE